MKEIKLNQRDQSGAVTGVPGCFFVLDTMAADAVIWKRLLERASSFSTTNHGGMECLHLGGIGNAVRNKAGGVVFVQPDNRTRFIVATMSDEEYQSTLAEKKAPRPAPTPVMCPFCGSKQISLVPGNRKTRMEYVCDGECEGRSFLV